MDEKELQELKLEAIMREFGAHPEEEQPDEQTPGETEESSVPEETGEIPVSEENEGAETPEEAGCEPEKENAPENEPVPEDTSDSEQAEVTELQPEENGEAAAEDTDQTAETDSDPDKTAVYEPVTEEEILGDTEITGDTIRLDGITKGLQNTEKKIREDMEITQTLEIPEKEKKGEPYSDQWEPEYEQPMGEYVPPQPIMFQPRSRLRELKKDLIAGPEKRYYEISEKGFGKIQTAIFFSFLVSAIAIIATVIYAAGMVTPQRMKLMVFGQFFTMLASGALASYLMIDGVTDMIHGKFTLNSMLLFTFAACLVDGILSLQQLKVPCCAAFCLQVTMALISAHERRRVELGQMDTMRKANHLDGVAICPDYLNENPALLRKEAQVSDFMDHYQEPSRQEKVLNVYALAALIASAGVAVLAGIFHKDVYVAFRVLAVTLLAAMPATVFITITRPLAVLENRLHALGTVLCGWKNVEKLSHRALVPLDHEDIYPSGSVRMNGVKFFGSRKPDQIVAYCTAVIAADEGGLTPVFTQVLDSRNGYHYDAVNLNIYDGGIGAEVEGEPVLVGTQMFLKKMGVEVPEGIRVSNAVCISIDGEFSGLFAVTYEKVRSTAAGLNTLCSYKTLKPVLVSSDFVINAQFLQSRFGIKPNKILMPDQAVRQQLREKQLPEDAEPLVLTTRPGLASVAYGITGAKSLQTSTTLGMIIHMIGGVLGLLMMVLLTVLGALDLLTPVNMFLYQLVWIIPGFLITEWTRSI